METYIRPGQNISDCFRCAAGDPSDPCQKHDPRGCPLHSECELYLKASECEYRNGEMTYEEAENQASDQSGFTTTWDGARAAND